MNTGNVLDTFYKRQIAFPDFSAGFAFISDNIYGGASVFHLTKQNIAFEIGTNKPLYRRGEIILGGFIPLQEVDRGWVLAPFLSHRSYLGKHPLNMYLLGCGVSKGIFTGGISHRGSLGSKNSGIINVLVGANINRLKIGYSYDLNDMGSIFEYAHELTLVLHLGKPKESHSAVANYFKRML